MQKAAEVAQLKVAEGSDPELKEYIPPFLFRCRLIHLQGQGEDHEKRCGHCPT